ncbi:MAG: DUF3137 domain-containing protein, partial [Thalassobaculaceae bacterium]
MLAIFALLSGKAALAAKPKFKTYLEQFDYEKGFAEYYEKNICPLAERFEENRLDAIKTARRRWFWSLPLLLLSFVFAMALIIFAENGFERAFLVLCLLLVLCIILYAFAVSPIKEYETRLREKIFPIIMKFFGSFEYQANARNVISKYKNYRIIPDYSNELSRNWISGSHAGVKFEAFDTTLSIEGSANGFSKAGFNSPISRAAIDVLTVKKALHVMSSRRFFGVRATRFARSSEEEIVFNGLVMQMAVHKKFEGRTIIRRDAGIVGNLGGALCQGLQRVNLEDSVFEQAFEVAASNQVEARYLLTPSFMERLLELSHSFNGAAIQGSFYQGSLL